MKPPFPTQREVARAAKVSQNTVSLALRGDPRLPAATRMRVQRAAARLGYRANPLICALMAQIGRKRAVYRETLALVMASPARKELVTQPSLRRALAGVRARALARGYYVDEFWLSDTGLPPPRLAEIMVNRGIHGLILHPDATATHPPELPWDQFASAVLAFLDRRHATFHCASLPPFRHLETAVQQIGLRRRPGRIGLAMPARYNVLMDGLYTAAFASICGAEMPMWVPEIWTREGFLEWFHQTRPTTLLVRSSEPREWLASEGIVVPNTVGLVHLGWHEAVRTWAGVDANAEAIGAAAVDLVVEQLQANERGLPAVPKIVLTNGCWRDGDTL